MAMRSLEEKYLILKDKTERIRAQIEEKNIKHLDPILVHTGDNPKMEQKEGIRSWWLWFTYEGIKDPPNKAMEFLGRFKVGRIEAGMSPHVASAEVFYDDTRERHRKVYVMDGPAEEMSGLDDLE